MGSTEVSAPHGPSSRKAKRECGSGTSMNLMPGGQGLLAPGPSIACVHADLRDLGYTTAGEHVLVCRKCGEVIEEVRFFRVAGAAMRTSLVL